MKNKAFNLRMRKDKRSGSQFIILEGETGVNHIEEIKKTIDSKITESNKIVFDLKNIVSFDMSTFQMLYSFRKLKNNKAETVIINTDFTDSVNTLLENTGISTIIKSWRIS